MAAAKPSDAARRDQEPFEKVSLNSLKVLAPSGDVGRGKAHGLTPPSTVQPSE
jgi:hypothetical protein